MLNAKRSGISRFVKRCVAPVMATVLAGIWCASDAQGPGGGLLDAVKREAAWNLQAKGVAKDLGLTDEVATKLVTAYTDSRNSMQETLQKAMSTPVPGANPYEAYQKLADEEKGKLKTAVSGFLNAEQTDKVLATLGSFNRQWDVMTDALTGMNLPAEKMDKVQSAVTKYVVDSDKVRAEAMAKDDRESARSAMEKLRTDLDTTMGSVLSAEELAIWKAATVFRGGRRGERGGNVPAPSLGGGTAALGNIPEIKR